MEADLAALEENVSLFEPRCFPARSEAIGFLESHILDRIESLPALRDSAATADSTATAAAATALVSLQARAHGLLQRLEGIDEELFRSLRADIRLGCRGSAFRDMVREHAGPVGSGGPGRGIGYDGLDAFLNGLLLGREVPAEIRALEPEMVYYQKTPARLIWNLVEEARLNADDVFFDLGSGLGQAAILTHLLSGAEAIGIEFEPAYCAYAREGAAELGLERVAFRNEDARQADYASGTVFFMYTPFEGAMLREVLARLHGEALTRRIRLVTYGPCTAAVSREPWLGLAGPPGDPISDLGVFESR
jgi:hypothetical protein